MDCFNDEYTNEYIFNESKRVLNEFYIKLFNNGVTIKDVKALKFYDIKLTELINFYENKLEIATKGMNKFISFTYDEEYESCYEYEVMMYEKYANEKVILDDEIAEINEIKNEIKKLMLMCRKTILKKFDIEDIKYITNETSLLHLIYSNNKHKKIRRYSKDSHMFMCQFHSGKKISFGVTDNINKCYCYKCKFCGDQIRYLMTYENLSFLDSLYLLAEIYLIEIENNPLKEHQLVNYYRNILISEDYINYIEKTIERLKDKGNIESLDYYIKHLNNINRIKNNELDKTINNKSKEKILKLENPF